MLINGLIRLALEIMFTPISDEVLLLTQLGIWASKNINPYMAWILAWIAIFIAFLWFYIVGRFFRQVPLIEKWMTKKWLQKAEKLLDRFGVCAIMLAFFIPGVRHPIHYMAGILKFPVNKYLLANLIASSLYTGIWTFIVYKFNQKIGIKLILFWLHQHVFIVLILLTILILGLIFYKVKKNKGK
ncbi:DedA family protein [Priestia megaterium]|jgi:membrane protein DedA with SNARE-associated domain|uniref:DedA family protein n=2 Tax=Priestia megaterium TaxID=1404 RepID=UPI000BEC22A7|nr:VTT domain-containing protein [Priestia megaterium]NGY70408.1 DedA family protein [Priestia megaterium]PED63433.1 DedA family protein [Priestia megaterium]PGK25004.1 DedA family protein [Priestia megaterium]PGO53770.1 DedA family protein [Priestia megaterium]PGX23270.1 DedA family protein [Priestia megaterium]